MSSSRVLITGINGLIGGVLQSALTEHYKVFGLDRIGPFSEQVEYADIAEYGQVLRIVQQFSPLEGIVHLAGNPRVKASWDEVLSANIVGTRNVFEAARESRVPRVVFASSNHVTGAYEWIQPGLASATQDETLKVSVADPIRPDSEYAVSKAFGEALARYYSDRWGIAAVCLRIGAVLKDDDPTRDPRNMKIWLSHRDLVQLVEKCLTAKVRFGIYYGVSNNEGAFWDLTNARAELGFDPLDDSAAKQKA